MIKENLPRGVVTILWLNVSKVVRAWYTVICKTPCALFTPQSSLMTLQSVPRVSAWRHEFRSHISRSTGVFINSNSTPRQERGTIFHPTPPSLFFSSLGSLASIPLDIQAVSRCHRGAILVGPPSNLRLPRFPHCYFLIQFRCWPSNCSALLQLNHFWHCQILSPGWCFQN